MHSCVQADCNTTVREHGDCDADGPTSGALTKGVRVVLATPIQGVWERGDIACGARPLKGLPVLVAQFLGGICNGGTGDRVGFTPCRQCVASVRLWEPSPPRHPETVLVPPPLLPVAGVLIPPVAQEGLHARVGAVRLGLACADGEVEGRDGWTPLYANRITHAGKVDFTVHAGGCCC